MSNIGEVNYKEKYFGKGSENIMNVKSTVEIRLFDNDSGHVAYKQLTIGEVEQVLKLLKMNLDKKCNEF